MSFLLIFLPESGNVENIKSDITGINESLYVTR